MVLCSGLVPKKKCSEEQGPAALKRTVSPKLRELNHKSWTVGRGKGGRKLSFAASLVKSKSEIGLTKFYKINKCAVGLVKNDQKKAKNM